MNLSNLEEKLANNTCHIHKQQPEFAILENGNLKFETCCLLFKKQLNLMVDNYNEKQGSNFAVV